MLLMEAYFGNKSMDYYNIIFLIYSFLGWVLESVYKSLLTRKIVNSGFITGPFCPIYGFGAVILYIFF